MSARAKIRHQRFPCAGLFAAAAAGVCAGEFVPGPIGAFWALALVFLGLWSVVRRTTVILLAVACVFGGLRILQGRDSAATRAAERLGSDTVSAMVTGQVVSEPVVGRTGKRRVAIDADGIQVQGRNLPVPAGVRVSLPPVSIAPGDRVVLEGDLRAIPPPRNPGQFDARRILGWRGITMEMFCRDPSQVCVEAPRGISLLREASRGRAWMEKTLRAGIEDRPVVCELLAGLVLGTTSDIPDSLQDEFRQTGTFHLFSVSGLHVGMLGVILWQLLRVLRLPRAWAVAVIVPALFFYAFLTGWKPSSVRAAFMASIVLLGMVSWRQPIALNSLCAAGLFVLAQSTAELFNPGFQLSFSVVAAILLLAPPLQDWIRKGLEPDPFLPVPLWSRWQKWKFESAAGLAGLLAVSMAAWLGGLPLTVGYFHMISLSALGANLVVVPLAFLIMTTAATALLGGLASQWLAAVFNNANLLLVDLLVGIIHLAAAMPASFVPVAFAPRPPASVVVFDAGSGGASGILSGGRLWFIDAGEVFHADSILVPWMRSAGHWQPGAVLVTHGDAEHAGGVTRLADPRRTVIWDSGLKDRSLTRRNLLKWIDENQCAVRTVQTGDRVSEEVEILHPPPDWEARLADDKAVVARFTGPGGAVLFLSDAGPPVWEALEKMPPDRVRAEVLVLGRHASGLLPPSPLVRMINPRLAILAHDENRDDPAQEADWSEATGVTLWAQRDTGAVTISMDAAGWTATPFLEGGADPTGGRSTLDPRP